MSQMAPGLIKGGMGMLAPSRASRSRPDPRTSPEISRPAITPTVTTEPSPPATAIDNSVAEVEMPKDCLNDIDPVTKRQLVIPKFSFEDSRQCLYQRNQAYLSRLARNGCANNRGLNNELFSTKFRSTSGHYILGQTDAFEGIVEGMSVVERNGGTITYRIQLLKPNLAKVPTELERVAVNVQKKDGKTYLLKRDMSVLTEVEIKNMVRTNMLTENLRGDATYVHLWTDAKLKMATNCELEKMIQSQQLYQKSAPGVGVKPASRVDSSK